MPCHILTLWHLPRPRLFSHEREPTPSPDRRQTGSARARGGPAMRLLSRLLKFVRNDDGPTAVEYAVMLSLIIVVCVASLTFLGRHTRREYRSVSRTLQKANSNTGS